MQGYLASCKTMPSHLPPPTLYIETGGKRSKDKVEMNEAVRSAWIRWTLLSCWPSRSPACVALRSLLSPAEPQFTHASDRVREQVSISSAGGQCFSPRPDASEASVRS